MKVGAIASIVDELDSAFAQSRQIDPIAARVPGFDVPHAYEVLAQLHARRVTRGWRPLGRKIGFTNTTIWQRYGVDRSMWSHVWDRTVHFARDDDCVLSTAGLMEPRIEPEVVFGLRSSIPAGNDPRAVLNAIEWIAPGFEIVHSVFPQWRFTAADCTAALGLHASLGVGRRHAITDEERSMLVDKLAHFDLALYREDQLIETGHGANVLGSPLLALMHLRDVLASQPQFPQLAAGEIVTTGTLTDAWPVRSGERWSSDYTTLGIVGLRVTLA